MKAMCNPNDQVAPGSEGASVTHWWSESEIVDTLRSANQQRIPPQEAFASFRAKLKAYEALRKQIRASSRSQSKASE